jgi:hypothetical protein
LLMSLTDFEGDSTSQFSPEKFSKAMLEISNILPSTFIVMLPKLHDILCSDSAECRLHFTRMFGKVLSLKDSKIPSSAILTPFLKRFIDADSLIRMEAIQFSKNVSENHPEFISDILEYLVDRLLDQDEKVRKASCIAFYEISKSNPSTIEAKDIEICSGRMLDKSHTVRKICIENMCELFLVLKDNDFEEKSNLVLSSLLRLFSIPLARADAEQMLDKKILAEGGKRLTEFLDILNLATPSQKKDLLNFLIVQKIKLVRTFSELLNEDNDASDCTRKLQAVISKILGHTISPTESANLYKFIFSKENITEWFQTVSSFEAEDSEIRCAMKEIEKSLKGSLCDKLVKSILPKVSMLIISPRDVSDLVEIASTAQAKSQLPDALHAMDLARIIASEVPTSLESRTSDLNKMLLRVEMDITPEDRSEYFLLSQILECLKICTTHTPIRISYVYSL